MVIGLRIVAFGFCDAYCRVVTAISASWRDCVPYISKCRRAITA
jgi:hypothetical protein